MQNLIRRLNGGRTKTPPSYVCAMCLLTLFAFSNILQGEPSSSSVVTPPLPVTVLTVQPQAVPNTIETVAHIEGAKETRVLPQVGGILLKKLYNEGAFVTAGQPLFQIDPAPYELVLAEARARSAQTAREAGRLKDLVTKHAISQKEYDDAVSADTLAQIALRQAQLNRSWTTVTAPVSGISGRATVSEGSLISTAETMPMTSIYQTDPIWVRFGLSESDIATLPKGKLRAEMITRIELLLSDGSVYAHPGSLNFISANIDPSLGTRQLRAAFINQQDRLMPGQFVRVRLQIGERNGVFRVPQSAVMQTERTHSVFVVGPNNIVQRRAVETAEWLGTDWLITAGLQAGDRVVTDNLMKLRPGMAVKPNSMQTAAPYSVPRV